MLGGNSIVKLMIVCTKETEKYGKYLMQLISQKDDDGETIVGLKDGSVEAVLWNEADYEANRKTLPASAYVLFVGDSKPMQEERANMEDRFNMYGMHFVRLGSKAVMYVDKAMLKKEEYDEFMKFSSYYGKNYKEKLKSTLKGTLADTNKLLLTLLPSIAGISSIRKAVNDQQYNFLTFYSYTEILPRILKG